MKNEYNNLSKLEINKMAEKWYFDVIKQISLNHPIDKYNKLKISNYYKNYRVKTSKGMMWKYNRHHIIEIYISGALLWNDSLIAQKYLNTDSIIVTLEEHAFLHYLIVLSQNTFPNDGITNQISYGEWIKIIKKLCVEYNIPYIENWQEYI
ncbi:hypothetical protein, partial [Mycoplasmopsis primatum]|uniref:hypothetical protein n=1 Tax=Mycoplasmopsis primatum TaxID=55604 RepID=UPI0006900B2B